MSPSKRDYEHLVIGGGISGISAAYYATRSGVDTLLIEGQARLGGCMHTHRFDTLSDFWVEAGSHSCFNSYGNLLDIMESLGMLGQLSAKEKRSYRLWRDGQRRSILSALHPLELAISLPRLFGQDKSGRSVAQYYGRGLGRRNYRDLFGPAFRSVICQDADDFPAQALFRKKPRRKEVLRSFTMPHGLSEIPTRIASAAELTTLTGQQATRVEQADDGFVVHLEGGDSCRAASITLAVPPDVAARLLAGIAPGAADQAAAIGVAEIDTLLLAFHSRDLSLEPIAGLISVDGAFLSAVSRDFLADADYRGFAFHFPGDRLSEQARLDAACHALDVAPAKVAAVAHARNRLPQLRTGHEGLIEQLDRALAGTRIAVTGNWFLGVSIEDCVTRSRQEHARLFPSGGRR